jgi:RimJ/RimL family protein N-acetyltransferase
MNTKDKPTLYGKIIMLRPINKDDTEAMWEAVNDQESNRFTGTQTTFTKAQITQWCETVSSKEGRIDLAIVPHEVNEYVGEVVLNNIDEDNKSANFRIALRGKDYFNRGWGSEAAGLILEYGFITLGLHRIELEVFSFNPRALHVYEKLGFKHEGVRREVLCWDAQYYDAITMSLLRPEYLEQVAKRAI